MNNQGQDKTQEQRATLRGVVVEDHVSFGLATELKEALASSVSLQSVSLRTATDDEIEKGSIESVL